MACSSPDGIYQIVNLLLSLGVVPMGWWIHVDPFPWQTATTQKNWLIALLFLGEGTWI